MDSSKNFFQGTEECSSNESGWTMYLGSSPDHELEQEDEEDDFSYGEQVKRKLAKKDVHQDDSDDSMASDASSGPSNLNGHVGNNDERKYVGKQQYQKEDKKQRGQQPKVTTREESRQKAKVGKQSNK